MHVVRRDILRLAAGLATGALAPRLACAETYPSRPVRMLVGFGPGQSIDIVARLAAQSLSERLNQPFVVENRPGAGGNIATESVVRAPPDGYTLMVLGANNAINATLYSNMTFDVTRDLVPIGGIYRVPQVVVVNPAFPATTLAEFIAYAKANPGKINFGSGGNGSVAHVAGEYFKMAAGVQMQHVGYRSAAQAVTDLIGGQVQVMFDNMPSSIEHIKAGRLRALAVCTLARLDTLPDVPTVSELVPGYETSAFAGIAAPKGTPPEVIAALGGALKAALAAPELPARIRDIGGVPMPLSGPEFGAFLTAETEKWSKVVKASGATPG